MHRLKTVCRHWLLSFPKVFLLGFPFLGLLFFANLAIAQSSSHNGGQWTSVGGKMLISGEGHFSNKWVAAHRYGHGNGKFWKNDEPFSNKTTNKQIPASHTPEEVTKDVWKRQGQITVRGPGYLGLFTRSKGAVSLLKDPKTGNVFIPHCLGKDEWLKGSDGKWKWYPGEVVNVDPTNSNAMSGWVPLDRTITLDVWVHNPFTDWGIWGRGHSAPKSVEYEFWFFPRKGGEIVKVIKYCPDGRKIDITTGDKPCKPGIPDSKHLCDKLKKTLSKYIRCRNSTLKSIGDFKKQIDAVSRPSAFNTGYYNEAQNNTLGNDPNWNTKNLDILKHGAGGSPSVSYLYNKNDWINQLKKSVHLQTQNLQKIDSEIAKIKREIQQSGCK